jgi:hypothetical protein
VFIGNEPIVAETLTKRRPSSTPVIQHNDFLHRELLSSRPEP